MHVIFLLSFSNCFQKLINHFIFRLQHCHTHQSSRGDEDIDDVNICDLESVFDTPRKIKLKSQLRRKQMFCDRYVRRLKTLQQKNKRLAKRNESLKSILKNLKTNRFVTDDVYDLLSSNIVAADIFNNIYKNQVSKKKKLVYSTQIKKICLTLNFLSPTAYKYVRTTFDTCLPHPKTLTKWYSNISGEPGFSDEAFLALKNKAATSERPIIWLTKCHSDNKVYGTGKKMLGI